MSLYSRPHLDIRQWLNILQLGQYVLLFEKYQGVEDLLTLSEADIKDLGVKNGAHRAKIVSSLVILNDKYQKNQKLKLGNTTFRHSVAVDSDRLVNGDGSSLSISDCGVSFHSRSLFNLKMEPMVDKNADPQQLKKALEWELSLDNRDLRSHAWYHGSIPRVRAEEIIEKDGDFLVRDCISQPGDYVLTCKWKGQSLHFVINKVVIQPHTVYERFQYQFEDDAFDTVPDLITCYVGSGKPVSAASGAKIQNPKNRMYPLSFYATKYGLQNQIQYASETGTFSHVARASLAYSQGTLNRNSPYNSYRSPVHSPPRMKKDTPPKLPVKTRTHSQASVPTAPENNTGEVAHTLQRPGSRHGSREKILSQEDGNSHSADGIVIDKRPRQVDVMKYSTHSLPRTGISKQKPHRAKMVRVTSDPTLSPCLERKKFDFPKDASPSVGEDADSDKSISDKPPPKPSRVPSYKHSNSTVINENVYQNIENSSDILMEGRTIGSEGEESENSVQKRISVDITPVREPRPEETVDTDDSGETVTDGTGYKEHAQDGHCGLSETISETTVKTNEATEGVQYQDEGGREAAADGNAACVYQPSGSDSGNGSGDSVHSATTSDADNSGTAPPGTLPKKSKIQKDRLQSDTRHSFLDCGSNTVEYDSAAEEVVMYTLPDLNPPSAFDLDNFQTLLLPNLENKPLDATALKGIKMMLAETGSRVIANHITKADLELIKSGGESDLGLGVMSGIELCTLPHGQQLRFDLIERTECLKLLVAVTILTCTTETERADALYKWIQVAIDIKTALGNLYGFYGVMMGLCLPQIQRLSMTWHVLRQMFTDSAFNFEAKLRPTLKNMNGCNNPQAPNTTIPHLLPLVLLIERTMDDLLGKKPSHSAICSWEMSSADFGLHLLISHLEQARTLNQSLGMYKRNAEIVLGDVHFDELMLDMFRSEFHLKFLWGSKGAIVASEDRHAKFQQVLTVMSERCEATM